MSNKVQSVRGMNDLVPADSSIWQQVEGTLIKVAKQFGYQEIRFPILEKTELFKRSIGEVTDIVEKEMYTFNDRNEESVTMRPEGTASCVRAGIQQGLLHNQIQKLWYLGPMFRYEKPQKGRLRQFHQFGIEAYGIDTPLLDAELITMAYQILSDLGLKDNVRLEINSLGVSNDREKYKEALVKYFSQDVERLDEDSKRRLHTNPLRILDTKNPAMADLVSNAPVLADYLSEESANSFERLKAILERSGIEYTVNTRLVRGLDYYNDLVFEWITEDLGAQGTVCAGGRYNRLVKDLGGSETAAAGFAIGIERITALYEEVSKPAEAARPLVYFLAMGQKSECEAIKIVQEIRASLVNETILLDCAGGNLKKQMKRSDRSGSRFSLILGEDELEKGQITIKDMSGKLDQKTVKLTELNDELANLSSMN